MAYVQFERAVGKIVKLETILSESSFQVLLSNFMLFQTTLSSYMVAVKIYKLLKLKFLFDCLGSYEAFRDNYSGLRNVPEYGRVVFELS